MKAQIVFVIRPFGKKKDAKGKLHDFDAVHRDLINPAIEKVGLTGGTTGDLVVDAGNIREDIFREILQADLVICDITLNNPNVYYELGIRHALRRTATVMIKSDKGEATPFDLLTDRYLAYPSKTPKRAIAKLVEALKATLATQRITDSPVFKMIPGLKEADQDSAHVLPTDFTEEVERASVARSHGWLRLLAEDVARLPFRRLGLKLVGDAQWKAKDYAGARETFEKVTDGDTADIAANLALANIYERLFKATHKPEMLESSEQVIRRVLKQEDVPQRSAAEAGALLARNIKTRWRLQFEQLQDRDQIRALANAPALLESYRAYREAFLTDLNHSYPGVAALQMGYIMMDLAAAGSWCSPLLDAEELHAERKSIERELADLRALVPAAVKAELARRKNDDPERPWAAISSADLQFMNAAVSSDDLVRAYSAVVPVDQSFYWDAARGQLQLFARLGIHAERARAVIEALNARVSSGDDEKKKKRHIIIVAGHRIDTTERIRFPESKVSEARALLKEALEQQLNGGGGRDSSVRVLASGASGTDIIAHEVCEELGIPVTMCLPMPPDRYARYTFENLDRWRKRFLELKSLPDALILASSEELPRWLKLTNEDPFERGNRWVLKVALSGAEKVTMIALWDGAEDGKQKGGTAHMVRIAREAGIVDIDNIYSKLGIQAAPATLSKKKKAAGRAAGRRRSASRRRP